MFAGLRRLGDSNPVALLSVILGVTGLMLPSIVPLRQALGYKTNQMTKTSPRSDAIVAAARKEVNFKG